LRDVNGEGKSHAQVLVEERTGRPLPELLRELYVERRWTDQEIATHVSRPTAKVSRATVRNWRGELGISRADRTTVLEQTVEAPE
jgi:hypothetical protein